MDATTTAEQTLGFGHFIAQADPVGKTLLALLVIMSVASWALIAAKGVSQYLRNKRSAAFLEFFWNARSLDSVQAEINTHGAHDPFSHLSAHALHAQDHHARYGASKLAEAGTATARPMAVMISASPTGPATLSIDACPAMPMAVSA